MSSTLMTSIFARHGPMRSTVSSPEARIAVSTWSRDDGIEDLAFALSFAAVDLDLDPSDSAGLLEVAEVELVSEQAFGLSEHRADDVGLVDDAFGGNAGSDLVFRGVRVVGHVRFSSWWKAPRDGRVPPQGTI